MKITKRQLRKIIKEELSSVFAERSPSPGQVTVLTKKLLDSGVASQKWFDEAAQNAVKNMQLDSLTGLHVLNAMVAAADPHREGGDRLSTWTSRLQSSQDAPDAVGVHPRYTIRDLQSLAQQLEREGAIKVLASEEYEQFIEKEAWN